MDHHRPRHWLPLLRPRRLRGGHSRCSRGGDGPAGRLHLRPRELRRTPLVAAGEGVAQLPQGAVKVKSALVQSAGYVATTRYSLELPLTCHTANDGD